MIRPIDCRTFEFWCEDLADASIGEEFRQRLMAHREACAHCADRAFEATHRKRAVRCLPQRTVPMNLAVNLRVMASKERARRVARFDLATRIDIWRAQLNMWAANLWKPIALPMAGGFASALILFSALMPTFINQGTQVDDVPAAWFQTAELSSIGPFGMFDEQLTVDVRVDSSGRVIDYTVEPGDRAKLLNKQLRRALENNLLFMNFKPASFFGQPASDTIRITIRRSQIEVKG